MPLQRHGVRLALPVAVAHVGLVDARHTERAVVALAAPGGAVHLARGRDDGALVTGVAAIGRSCKPRSTPGSRDMMFSIPGPRTVFPVKIAADIVRGHEVAGPEVTLTPQDLAWLRRRRWPRGPAAVLDYRVGVVGWLWAGEGQGVDSGAKEGGSVQRMHAHDGGCVYVCVQQLLSNEGTDGRVANGALQC